MGKNDCEFNLPYFIYFIIFILKFKKISFGVYIWEKQKLEVQQFWL